MIKGWLGAKLTNFLEEWNYFPTMFSFEYPSFFSLSVSSRRRSRINTDQFPKRAPKAQASRRFWGNALLGNVFDFNFLKYPFLGFWAVQTGCCPVPFSSDEAFQLGKIFSIKNVYYENVTDFRNTVETGVDPRLKAFLVSGSWRTYLDRKTDIITRKLCGYITFIVCSTVVLFWTSCQKQ